MRRVRLTIVTSAGFAGCSTLFSADRDDLREEQAGEPALFARFDEQLEVGLDAGLLFLEDARLAGRTGDGCLLPRADVNADEDDDVVLCCKRSRVDFFELVTDDLLLGRSHARGELDLERRLPPFLADPLLLIDPLLILTGESALVGR